MRERSRSRIDELASESDSKQVENNVFVHVLLSGLPTEGVTYL